MMPLTPSSLFCTSTTALTEVEKHLAVMDMIHSGQIKHGFQTHIIGGVPVTLLEVEKINGVYVPSLSTETALEIRACTQPATIEIEDFRQKKKVTRKSTRHKSDTVGLKNTTKYDCTDPQKEEEAMADNARSTVKETDVRSVHSCSLKNRWYGPQHTLRYHSNLVKGYEKFDKSRVAAKREKALFLSKRKKKVTSFVMFQFEVLLRVHNKNYLIK